MDTLELAATRLYKGLQPGELKQVRAAAVERRVENDTFLFHQGDPAEYLYMLVEGRMHLIQVTSEGQQVILNVASPFEALGVMALLDDASYPVSAQAVENSRVLAWSEAQMRRLMGAIPQIAINAVEIMAKRSLEFQARLVELTTERVERRVARALLRLAHQTGRKVAEGVLIDMPLSRQDLAEMTGTTLYTVSRLLSQWETQGLVQSRREQVIIRFPHGLVMIAEDLPTRNIKV